MTRFLLRARTATVGAAALLLMTGVLQPHPAMAAGTGASAATSAAAGIPVRKWVKAYLTQGMQTHAYAPHTQIEPPLLWVYNPSGKPIGFFTAPDGAKLKALLAHFPKAAGGAAVAGNEPDLGAMNGVLKATGAPTVSKPAAGQYTAVIYVKPQGCSVCTHFEKMLHAAAGRDPGKLRVVRVKLVLAGH